MLEFPKKWEKRLGTFKDAANAMKDDELKRNVIEANKLLADTEKDEEEDQDLNAAKESVKELKAQYSEICKDAQAKSRYCIYLLRSRGVL